MDNEGDGQPNADATGDDIAGIGPAGQVGPAVIGTIDDEDGVTIPSMTVGEPAIFTINVQTQTVGGGPAAAKQGLAGPFLDAWIDWNQNGVWTDPGEQIAANFLVATGDNPLMVSVPLDAVGGNTFARFRLSLEGGLTPTGEAQSGEVEDHLVNVIAATTRITFAFEAATFTTYLDIVDIAAGGKNDQLTITADDANSRYVIHDPVHLFEIDGNSPWTATLADGNHTVHVPYTDLPPVPPYSAIRVKGLEGDDSVTVDFSQGTFQNFVEFVGGNGNDGLTLIGGGPFAEATVAENIFIDPVSAVGPAIGLTGHSPVVFEEVETVEPVAPVTDFSFNYGDNPDTVTVQRTQTTFTSFPFNGAAVIVLNPTGSLTINGGGGDDTINVESLGSGFNAALNVNGQGGTGDIINVGSVAGVDTGTGEANLTASAGVTIKAGAGLTTDGGAVTIDADSDNSGPGIFLVESGSGLSTGMTGGGYVEIKAADVDIRSAISAPGSYVDLNPSSSAIQIDLGSPNGGGFILDNAELDHIAADEIWIGAGGSSQINLNSAMTPMGAPRLRFGSTGPLLDKHSGGADISTSSVEFSSDIQPGNDGEAGILEIGGNVDLRTSARLHIELGGTTPGSGHDQLKVVGLAQLGDSVVLLGAASGPALFFELLPEFALASGQSFTIVDNDGSDPVIGTFDGLPEGATIPNFAGSSLVGLITYQGGTGNDVVLNLGEPPVIEYPNLLKFYVDEPISPPVGPSVSGGTADSFSRNGTLAAGLVFSASTGEFSGTPTAFKGHTTYSVTAVNAFGSGSDSFAIQVLDRRTVVDFDDMTGTLTVTDISSTSKSDNLIVNVQDGDLVLTDAGARFFKGASAGSASINLIGEHEARIPRFMVNSISIDLRGGDDQLDFSFGTGGPQTDNGSDGGWRRVSTAVILPEGFVTIDLGGGADQVGFIGGDTMLESRSLTVRNAEAVFVGGDVSASGDVLIEANERVLIQGGRIDVGGSGNVTINANQGEVPASGNFAGISVSMAGRISTLNGSITLRGRGGDSLADNVGVLIETSSSVAARGSGQVTIEGTGGPGMDLNHGARINGATVSTLNGNLSISGGSGGTGDFNEGVLLDSGAEVTTSLGRITVNGTGSPSAVNGCQGIVVAGGAKIASTGNEAGTGFIDLIGAGGSGAQAIGVQISEPMTKVSSLGGDITIAGAGGGEGGGAHGVQFDAGALIDMTGDVRLTIGGTGSAAGSGRGVSIVSGAGISGDASAGTLTTLTGTGKGGEADIFFDNLALDSQTYFDGVVQGTSLSAGAGVYDVHYFKGGTIAGAVSHLNDRGVGMQGNSPALLATGDLNFNTHNEVRFVVTGAIPGAGHDQFNATGAVDLGGASLKAFPGAGAIVPGDEIVLVANDGADAVTGMFNGLPEGTTISLTPQLHVTISYVGGDGNDVVLNATLPPAPTISYPQSDYEFTVGQALSPDVEPALGGGPVGLISVSPPLPAGLGLDSATGRISGTPSVATGSASYVVTASNDGGSAMETLTITVSNPAMAPADGLLLHWKLDDVAGPNTTESVSGSTSVATVIGPVTSSTRMSPDTGSAASFGTDSQNPSYINAGTLTASGVYQQAYSHSARRVTGAWTISAWINLSSTALPGDNVIASTDTSGSDWWLFMPTDGELAFDFNSARIKSGLIVPRDQPVFVAIIADNSGEAFEEAGSRHMFAMFDGVNWQYSEGTYFDEIRLLGLEIGSFNHGIRQFDGAIDDVRIHDRALGQSALDELVFATRLVADGSGKLIVSDLVEGGKPDNLTVRSDNGNSRFIVSDPDNVLQTLVPNSVRVDAHTIQLPFSEIHGSQLRFQTGGGDDSLTVDFDAGLFSPSVVYVGGDTGETEGDSLTLAGEGVFASGVFQYTDASSGTIDLTGNAIIQYTGLEPIDSLIQVRDVALNFGAAAETIAIGPGAEPGTLVANSTAGERTTFLNPTIALTVSGGEGLDAIGVNGLGAGFTADFVVRSPGDALNFVMNSTVTMGSITTEVGSVNVMAALAANGGLVALRAETDVLVAASISTQGGSIVLNSDTDQAAAPGGGILVNGGAMVSSAGGDIILGGGDDPAMSPAIATGVSEDGVHIGNATLDAGAGSITILGRSEAGGDDGVEVDASGLLRTTSGNITVTGSSSADDGVDIDPGGRIQSDSGNVTLNGFSDGATGDADAVTMDGAGTVVQTTSGQIRLTGQTMGPGNDAVHIYDGATVTSQDGAIHLAGTAQGFSDGVDLGTGGKVLSTGSGTITITGTAGTSGDGGVEIEDSGTAVTAVNGAIQITGTAEGSGDGVDIDTQALIRTTGSASITITGTSGSSSGEGVDIGDAGTLVTSVNGAISITGSNDNNDGVYINNGVTISSTGIGAGAATITIMGTSAASNNEGVDIGDEGVMVTSVDGDISITGVNTADNDAVYISSGGVISSTGTGANAANITIHGTTTSANHEGVDIDKADTKVSSVDGDISITGINLSTGDGIEMDSGSAVLATGDGNISIHGDTADPDSESLDIGGGTGAAQIVSGTGNIAITAANSGVGLLSYSGATIASTGGGDITLTMNRVGLHCAVMSAGNLSVAPLDPATSIGLGGGSGTLDLDDSELANLADGFARIQIGDAANGNGAVNIDTATFNDPVTISGGVITDATGADLTAPSVVLDGNVSPGMSPGILNVGGDFAFATGSMLTLEMAGANAGEGAGFHDRVAVTGKVNLAGVPLVASFTGGFMPTVGAEFVVVSNDGADAVSGTFADLAQDDLLLITGQLVRVSYVGGDGNDVTLTVLQNVFPPYNHVAIYPADMNGDIQGLFLGDPGAVYELWVAVDLPNWTFVRAFTASQDGFVTFSDFGVGALPRRFYQIRKGAAD